MKGIRGNWNGVKPYTKIINHKHKIVKNSKIKHKKPRNSYEAFLVYEFNYFYCD